MGEDREYAEFRRRYEARHPASVPVKRPELPPYPRWLQWATLLMFISSAVLSGVHTIPVVRAGIPADVDGNLAAVVSFAAFFSVELAILLSAYAMIGGGGFFISGVLFLATLTALVANIYSVTKAYEVSSAGGDIGTLVVAVIIGIVAPGIAFLSGKMFVNMHRSDRNAQQRAEAAYRQEAQAWDERVGRAWDSYQSRVQPPVQLDTSSDSSGRGASNAASKVREYLDNNPDGLSKSVRELADLVGVSKSTVAQVKQEYTPGQNHNGTH